MIAFPEKDRLSVVHRLGEETLKPRKWENKIQNQEDWKTGTEL